MTINLLFRVCFICFFYYYVECIVSLFYIYFIPFLDILFYKILIVYLLTQKNKVYKDYTHLNKICKISNSINLKHKEYIETLISIRLSPILLEKMEKIYEDFESYESQNLTHLSLRKLMHR